MLRVCSSILLLSGVSSFIESIQSIAEDIETVLEVSDTWNINYRIYADAVICGSKYLDYIGEEDYSKVRLVLKTNETVMPFIQKGITHFIFDYTNRREVAFSMFTSSNEAEVTETVQSIISQAHNSLFKKGSYFFNFNSDTFRYNNVGIYLRKSEKDYLAKWLLLGQKDNGKRILLYKMRQRFGIKFLTDVDRKGKFIGEGA